MADAGKDITSIDLTNCNMNQSLGIAMAELFSRQKGTIEHICLKENPNFGIEGLRHLLVTFDSKCALKVLNLRNTGLHDLAVSHMIKALHCLPNIANVNLGYNNLTAEGVELFAAFLRTNTTIQTVVLAHNKMRDEGALSLANHLAENMSVRSLDINTCRITDAGAVHIGLMLANQPNITQLNFSKNPITELGVDGLSELLQRNTGLVEIVITGVEKTKLERIQKITKRNKTFVGNLVPYKLDRELQRLFVQQYKLEVANQQLRELHQETARIQDQARQMEQEFDADKQDLNQKAKKLVETLDFTYLSIQDLQRKHAGMITGRETYVAAKEGEIETLELKLADATADRERIEAQANEEEAKYTTKVEAQAGREEEINQQIEQCKVDTQKAIEEFKETQLKIEEITKQVEELEKSSGMKAPDPPPAG